jgi:hypothetical protein
MSINVLLKALLFLYFIINNYYLNVEHRTQPFRENTTHFLLNAFALRHLKLWFNLKPLITQITREIIYGLDLF